MERALDLCINLNRSCLSISEEFNIPEPTLRRYIKRIKQNTVLPVNGGRFKDTFSNEHLELLKTYIIDIERRAFGLTKLQFQKLVYDFAENNGIPYSFNTVTKIAGEGWLAKFMKHCRLSFRTPEAASVGRLMGFNKVNVDLFFSTLK